MRQGRVRQRDIPESFRSTMNAISDLLKIKDSKVAAKQDKMAKAASQAMSVSSSNVGSQPISTSSGSTLTSPSISSSSNIKSRKRPAPEPLLLESKRNRPLPPGLPPGPTTPDNPTQLGDPNDTGGTTSSKDEETTKKLLGHFVENTLSALDLEFTQLRFSKSPHRVELKKTYIHCIFTLII
jgi:hypothetical protein